jgi:L-ascorbate metabolism protein UlaG (beta-lactamase superfamily)
MQLIGADISLKWAALCLGDRSTMGIRDALRAVDFLRCRQIIGIHFDTFLEIRIDQSMARKLFATEQRTLFLMRVGATKEI